ncbi:GGDEF domain-containing protein [Alloalcanivorax sp. C16-2]|uniref:GGDEF domain-containing protein n=1 Tax=Alloalcanivorax TaxID=3020832 RepID=UPI001EE4B0B8|nr:GGDEF domain-containing protein [Alloalcanivorax marinus]
MKDESQRMSRLPSGNDIHLPWHLRLPAPLERDFADFFRDSVARVAPWAALNVAVLLSLALALEFFLSPEVAASTWRPRLLCLMLAVATALVARHGEWRRWLHGMSMALAMAVALTGDWMAVTVNHPLAFSLFLQTPLAILLMSVLLRVPFYWAVTGSLAMIGVLAACLYRGGGTSEELSLVLLLLSLSSASMSLFGQYIYERLLRQHFLSENVLFQHRDELHSANRVLESQATVDGLTGCLNRRGMESRLDELLHGFGRGQERVTLLLFDIDFFKQYNDTYGHLAGDECLKAIASIPRALTQGDKDFVARYGGEEFMVVLANTSLKDALVVAERMRTRIEQLGLPHSGSRVSQVVTISVGVACAGQQAADANTLIKCADEALYQAKGAGRNQVAYMDDQGRVLAL